METKIKYQPKRPKKNTTTKRVSNEYAIINENGEVKATNNEKIAFEYLEKGYQVFNIITYQIKIKQKLIKKED